MGEEDFRILLGAELSPNIDKEIQARLDGLKKLHINVSDISLGQNALNQFQNQLKNNKISLNLDIPIGNSLKQDAQRAGQQAGVLIADSVNKAIGKVSAKSIGQMFRIAPTDSKALETEIKQLVDMWTKAKGKLSAIQVNTKTVYDKDAEANLKKIDNIIVKYTNDMGEAIQKKIAWQQIGIEPNIEGETKALYGWVEAVEKYSKSIKKTNPTNESLKLASNISSELSKIEALKITNPELNSFKTEINGATVSLEKLINQFKSVQNESDFSVAKATMQAFKDAADASAAAARASSEYDKLLNKARNAISGGSTSSVDTEIKKIEASYQKLSRLKSVTPSLQTNFDALLSLSNKMKGSDGQDLINNYDKWQKILSNCKNEISQINIKQREINQVSALVSKKTSMISNIDAYLSKNPRVVGELHDQFLALKSVIADVGHGSEIAPFQNQLTTLKNKVKAAGLEGRTFGGEMQNSAGKVLNWLGATTVVMRTVQEIEKAVNEIKELDDVLTEINKTSDLTNIQLKALGKNSYEAASRYGKKASDYLTGVQEMYRAGYKNAEKMAELSVLTQAAGDIDINTANDYLIATDAAYKYQGNIEKLTAALDGMNYVTNHNALSMADLAKATEIAASQSASSNVAIEESTAAMGTMIATTRQGGDIAARAWKGILMNLQQVKGEVEDGEIIDEEQLSKYEKASEALGVSLKEVKNGTLALRDPIEILKELSQAYTSLDKSDVRRANLINAVGGKYRGNQLNALLENWDTYEKMLSEYSQGSGSAMSEAEKSANNLTGSLNKLSNTWTNTVNNVVDSDGLKFVINSLNSILSLVNSITGGLGSFRTLGLGVGLYAGLKNVGGDKMFSLENAECMKFSLRQNQASLFILLTRHTLR